MNNSTIQKVTAIFGPPPPPPLPPPPTPLLLLRNDETKSGHRVVNQSDTQLLFNIEALKIAKKARDLREKAEVGKNKEAKVRGKSFFQQLRKFRSLPNLSAIRNLKMIRNLSRSRILDTVEEDRCLLLCPHLISA